MNSTKSQMKDFDSILFQLGFSTNNRCLRSLCLTLLHTAGWLTEGFSLSKEEAYTTVLLIGIRKEARSQMLHLSRNKRYTLTPEQLKWDKFKLTYKYSFEITLHLFIPAKFDSIVFLKYFFDIYTCTLWVPNSTHWKRKYHVFPIIEATEKNNNWDLNNYHFHKYKNNNGRQRCLPRKTLSLSIKVGDPWYKALKHAFTESFPTAHHTKL